MPQEKPPSLDPHLLDLVELLAEIVVADLLRERAEMLAKLQGKPDPDPPADPAPARKRRRHRKAENKIQD